MKRAGTNFKALCPFHNEKTASFVVSPQKQIYHCFGCGKGGNALHFVMEYEKLTFYEALKMLAERVGLQLPMTEKTDTSTPAFLYKINEFACQVYHNQLLKNSRIEQYLKSRGLGDDDIKLFKLGFAPNSWDFMLNTLRGKNMQLSFIEKSGLISAKTGGGYRDLLRNRIIIPIEDVKSRVVGFGARRISDEDKEVPKYINSPETDIYHKRRILFGLNHAKDTMVKEDRVALVEGYFDVIIPFCKGFKTIVAPLGTSLTSEQVRLLKRYTQNIILLFDRDEAGIQATMRALEVSFSEDVYPRIVVLPQGEDPASYVLKEGIKKFVKQIDDSQAALDFILQYLTETCGTTPEGKRKIFSRFFSMCSRINNLIVLDEYMRKASLELGIKEEIVRAEFNRFSDGNRQIRGVFRKEKEHKKVLSPEKILLKILIDNPNLIAVAKKHIDLSDFMDEEVREIFDFLYNASNKDLISEKPHLLFVEKPELSTIISELEFIEIDNDEMELEECIRRISIYSKERLCRMLQENIVAAEKKGQPEKQMKLLDKYNKLKRVIEHEKKEVAKRH